MWLAKILDDWTLKIHNQQQKDYWVLLQALYQTATATQQSNLENDQNAYVDISELENKPLPNEGSLLIFESFEDLYEGRLQHKNA